MTKASRLAAIFIAMALMLAASVGVLYWMGLVVIDAGQQAIHERDVYDSLDDTLSTMKDAETGQRGYLLTSDPRYLDPYHSALKQIGPHLDLIGAEAAAGDIERGEAEQIIHLANTKLAELEQTIHLFQAQKGNEAFELVRLGTGKNTMDALRDHIRGSMSVQRVKLNNEQHRSDILTIARSVIFACVALFNLGFLFWSFRQVQSEMRGRELATLETLRQKELLAVTLASIGDGVIVTDIQGRVTFLNDVAARMTGHSGPQVRGEPCDKVFHIINEETRQIVESPVDKVLRLGTIVGLANHTLLIRRDGSEIPIDDSGAPIRDENGAIRGVVLVFRDFSKHKNIENNLRAAKSELEAASKAKDQFLATLSHELRTPLTPVLATLTSWESSDELPAGFREDIQMLRRNISLEARLIDDLLDLTRIVKGKLPLEPEVVDAHELLEAVSGMYRSEIHAKGVQLELELSAGRHFINADPGRMQQVFWNVLKNATKFTPEGGRIRISSANNGDASIQIAFQDTGIGMSEQMLGRLFLPFEQGSDEVVRRSGGLGLGMAISKALLDVQGGEISAASEGQGKGSIFKITLRTVAGAAAARPATKVGADGHARRGRLLRILLVEDHADTARVMARLLRRLGHQVQTSDSVAGALDLARAGDFDVLVSDIGLPDGTGLELIRQIREMKDIPAVALTGFGMDDDIAKCREAGFIAHLTKPVNFQRLQMVIQQAAMTKDK